MNLETAKRKAQEAANSEGQRIAVRNLNSFSPCYVLRYIPDNLLASEVEKEKDLVFIAYPKKES